MKVSLSLFTQMSKTTRKFLFWFSNEHSNFKFAELESLFKLFQLETTPLKKASKGIGPFVLLDFPSEDIPKQIMSRSFLAHSCYEIWSSGNSMEECHSQFKENFHFTTPYINSTFKIKVDTFGNSISQTEKLEIIETFRYIPLEGKVDLKNPECSLHLIQYFGLDGNNTPEKPYHVFFGRWISNGQRHLISKTSLKNRKFIGNTSMDPLLSLLMSNLALVKENDLVLDPFVGTGSLLVSAALMGAFTFGTDIDYLMLHARTRPSRARQETRDSDESVRANFRQYGVEDRYLDVLVADASHPSWKSDVRFDAIITDPPYGVRESTERVGSLTYKEVKEEHISCHYPAKIEYSLTDIFCDLIDFGARQLAMGGRMVFWIPISRDAYDEEKLPSNPCFKVLANCEQVLTMSASRRLLVLEKIAEPSELCCSTVMDKTALMYRFQFFNPPDKSKTNKEKKSIATAKFGAKGSKRGQEIC